jgi:hypothetical protein
MKENEMILAFEGCDIRNGEYPYEVFVYWRKGKYIGESDFVAVKEVCGGLNRNSETMSFESSEDAIQQCRRWLDD